MIFEGTPHLNIFSKGTPHLTIIFEGTPHISENCFSKGPSDSISLFLLGLPAGSAVRVIRGAWLSPFLTPHRRQKFAAQRKILGAFHVILLDYSTSFPYIYIRCEHVRVPRSLECLFHAFITYVLW